MSSVSLYGSATSGTRRPVACRLSPVACRLSPEAASASTESPTVSSRWLRRTSALREPSAVAIRRPSSASGQPLLAVPALVVDTRKKVSGIAVRLARMNWAAFTTAAPELAKIAEERFGAFTHHVLATLRKDGSPRTTGLEVRFVHGELWLGMMPDSLKALDLRRDPRFALQANPGPGTGTVGGDVRINGRAVEVEDAGTKGAYVKEVEPPQPFHLFRTELTEVVRTYVEDDAYLVVEVWKPGEPVRTLKRT